MTDIKKAAPGAANTESGKDKSTISSVAESPGNVKAPPRATAQELAALLRKLIMAMRRQKISDTAIVWVLIDTLDQREGRENP